MPHSIRPGDVLADRYRLVDLLSESGGGRFWRAHDRVLQRHVALHVIAEDDPRADGLLASARRSAMVLDPRILRVLDAERRDGLCYVVNEWGSGTSLDIVVDSQGPLAPRPAAWLVAETAHSIARAHAAGIAHGRLVPENILIDRTGSVKIIGLAVDAALHGLPDGRISTDLVDLGALLHCALTARWGGTSTSEVLPAPAEHGHPLRPRRVRAGVPRHLDALCEQILGLSGGPVGVTAEYIHDYLADFVGDPTDLAEQLAAVNVHGGDETVILPPLPEVRPHEVAPPSSGSPTEPPAPRPEPQPLPEPPSPPPAEDLPTQAGMPVFDDINDDVSWLTAHGEPAPPPPPFEEPEARPLFAPDPPEGRPLRQVRDTAKHKPVPPAPRAAERTSDHRGGFWPWDTTAGPRRPEGGDPPEVVPGRSWLRLAASIAAAILLLIAIVVAFDLGRGDEPDDSGGADDPSSSASPTDDDAPEAAELLIADATDLDPQGDPPEENPEEVALAVDGDPGTAWTTATYNQQFGPGGLKDGVGLVIDLGEPLAVSEVDLVLAPGGTSGQIFVSDLAPTTVNGLTPAAGFDADESAEVVFEAPSTGQFVTIWLTALPPTDDGRFRAGIAEAVVRG